MKKIHLLFAGLTMTLAANLSFAQTEEAPKVTVTPIKGPLYMLDGRGGNLVASVGDDGVLLIDADYAPWAEAHAQAIAEIDPDAASPRFLLNTHWHGDHVGGNEHWGKQGTVIMAHENIYQRMSTRQEMKALGRVVEPSPAAALPVVTYEDSIAVRFNGDVIQVQHFPNGHTDGDSIVFFTEQNVVHIGDHVFENAFPFVDVGSGGNVIGYLKNLDKVLEMTDDQTIIVPGHGTSLMSKQDLQQWVTMLKSSVSRVAALLKSGQTVEDIAENGLGAEYDSFGQGFIKEPMWIAFIAASL
ncbi:MAG: MBL fold metallo-hydrolase [Halioglobus sp.]